MYSVSTVPTTWSCHQFQFPISIPYAIVLLYSSSICHSMICLTSVRFFFIHDLRFSSTLRELHQIWFIDIIKIIEEHSIWSIFALAYLFGWLVCFVFVVNLDTARKSWMHEINNNEKQSAYNTCCSVNFVTHFMLHSIVAAFFRRNKISFFVCVHLSP